MMHAMLYAQVVLFLWEVPHALVVGVGGHQRELIELHQRLIELVFVHRLEALDFATIEHIFGCVVVI
eukprot:SAG31_NODE_3674_length_3999_cov_1.230769_2_plen_67_part_00